MARNKYRPKSVKRKHHELPRLYLQGFCEGSFFWIFKRGKPYAPGVQKPKYNPYRSGIYEAGRRDRYTFITLEGRQDFETYENRLSQEEHKTDEILTKIRSQKPISESEKEVFAEYIQLTYKRTSEREKKVLPITNEILKSISWDQNISRLAMNGKFKVARELSKAKDYLESDGKKPLLFESMLTPYPKLHKVLLTMKWAFYIAPVKNFFVTSNSPVTFDRSVGLLRSPLLFPISNNLAMIATWNEASDLQYVKASSDETLAINYLAITQALEVYSPKPAKWIWEILDHGIELRKSQLLVLKELFPFCTN